MTRLKLCLAITTALLVATASWAQQSTPSPNGAGSFQNLAPGEQKIGRALFLAQQPTATGPAPLSLNQIAALKEHDGWGNVFKQMQAQGLIHSKNLGQVVSGYEHHLHAGRAERGGTMVVTKGTGRTSVAGSVHDGGAADRRGASDAATGEGSSRGSAGSVTDHDDTITVANASGGTHGSSNAGGSSTHGGATAHSH
jgi:hypothetical protein